MTTDKTAQVELDKDTVLIADWGRSAQGWLSFMLCYILNARFIEPYHLLGGTQYSPFPKILQNTKGNLAGRSKTPIALIVKTHNLPSPGFNLTDNVVFLTRDPRDVAVAFYYFSRNLCRAGSWNWRNRIHSIPLLGDLLVAFRWGRHYRRWKHIPAHKVRYEDLRADTAGTLKNILAYLKVEVDPALVDEAVAIFDYENMYGRKRGVENKFSMDARKGIVGDYRNHFSWLMNRMFWKICSKEAEAAGYRLDGGTTIEPTEIKA